MCDKEKCENCKCGNEPKKSINKTKGETISKQKDGEIGKPRQTFEK